MTMISGMRKMLIPMISLLTNPLVLGGLAAAAGVYAYKKWGETASGLKQQIMRNDAEISSLKNQLQYLSPTVNGQPNPEYEKKKGLLDSKIKEGESLKTKLKEVNTAGPEKVDESIWDKMKNFGKSFIFDDYKLDVPELNLPEMNSGMNFNFTSGGVTPNASVDKISGPQLPSFDAGNGSNLDMPKPAVNLTNVTPAAMPAAAVETPSVENSDTKLQTKVSVSVPKVQNNVTNMKQGSEGIPLRKPIPSVRNMEEWYNRALDQNTRLPY